MSFQTTSSMVVDLSGDNDSAGALAAATTIPSASQDAGFERSCDNPECSAPKLISLVPKKETSEFITDPVVMDQPTLINGFTTVFQIDGIGARMNEIMYGDNFESSSNAGTANPRSVFRIVPNTHAHIVNYVVVDGAGETMRKIKANDADTMRKLLDSQRLSAEQMLKKLIGKAFKTTSKPSEPSTHETNSVKMPETNPRQATEIKSVPTMPPLSSSRPIPDQMSKPTTADLPKPLPANVLPTVPPGITITPISPNLTLNAPTPVLRKAIVTPPTEGPKCTTTRPTALKRKLVSTPIPDVIKRLRPRSPKTKKLLTLGLQEPPTTPALKLPFIAKQSSKAATSVTVVPVAQSTPETNEGVKAISATKTTTNKNEIEINRNGETELLPPAEPDKVITSNASIVSISEGLKATTPGVGTTFISKIHKALPVKPKPLMGPASKMNALKALAAAPANQKVGIKAFPTTKPCTVSIPKVDVPHELQSINFLNKDRATTSLMQSALVTPAKLAPLEAKAATPSTSEVNALITAKTVETTSLIDTAAAIAAPTSSEAPTLKPMSAPKPPVFSNVARKSISSFMLKTSPQPIRSTYTSKLEGLPIKITRASTPKMAALVTKPTRVSMPMSKSFTALSNTSEKSHSLQSKSLRVVLPPITSPHPNLKISSVISGGTAVAAATLDDANITDVIINESNSSEDIEKLQQELADLRRTVARLTKKKPLGT